MTAEPRRTRTRYRAAILDLDGVLTRTATQHGRAWKKMFDEFLQQRGEREGEDHSPFDIRRDYLHYVDGKPRLEGVRSFLASRGITLPDGVVDASSQQASVQGLGDRKNAFFLELLDRDDIVVFDDAVDQLHRWREEGLPTALVTSSRNGRRILRSAGLMELFDVIVDGIDAEQMGLRGKPEPDTFLHAARELGVEPGEAILVEDAISGVQAGRAGAFGLVVGVAREGAEDLARAGADIVVHDLREVHEAAAASASEPGEERREAQGEAAEAEEGRPRPQKPRRNRAHRKTR